MLVTSVLMSMFIVGASRCHWFGKGALFMLACLTLPLERMAYHESSIAKQPVHVEETGVVVIAIAGN